MYIVRLLMVLYVIYSPIFGILVFVILAIVSAAFCPVETIVLQVGVFSIIWIRFIGVTISKNLSTANYPDPDLLIRTSGEYRLSNYLLWQLAYTELFFTPTLWPDFNKEGLYEAIISFQNRERRFGKTSEQLKK